MPSAARTDQGPLATPPSKPLSRGDRREHTAAAPADRRTQQERISGPSSARQRALGGLERSRPPGSGSVGSLLLPGHGIQNAIVFNIEDRDRVRDRMLDVASSDPRVVAGAVVGSLAHDEGDRWSDLDLTFAVADNLPILDVLEDWTRTLVEEFDAAYLFDLPSGASIYRVFLLPGCLQFDLSFTPASRFGASGPKFKMIFGTYVEKPYVQPPSAHELFGYAVHHALRARFCIERGRYWQAEYWISSARDYVLSMACRRRGLPPNHGRGFDALPADVLNTFSKALISSSEREELMRALSCVIDGMFHEVDEVQELATKVEPRLRELTLPWDNELKL